MHIYPGLSLQNKGLHKQSDRNPKPQRGTATDGKETENETGEEEGGGGRVEGKEKTKERKEEKKNVQEGEEEMERRQSKINPREWHLWKM